MKRLGFIAEGTTCESCSEIIKKQALKIEGVSDISFDYSTETGFVTFDDKITDIDTILYKIEEKNYNCFILDKRKINRTNLGWIFAVIGILIIGYFFIGFLENSPQFLN